MDIYLRELANEKSEFRFPSLPQGKIDVKHQTAYQTYNIIGRGRRSFPAGMDKESVKWEGYFWGESRAKMKMVNRVWIAPKECIKKLHTWQKQKTP